MRLRAGSLVLALLYTGTARAQEIPDISLLRGAPAGFLARVPSPASTLFNAAGNILVGQCGHPGGAGGADLLLELTPGGATVWECRLAPGGSLTGFARGADGTTLVAQHEPGRFTRVVALDRRGAFVRGWGIRGSAEPPPPVATVQPTADGGLAASVAGYAFGVTRRGTLSLRWSFGRLKSAIALADGRWLAALSRPERFAVYDPSTRTLASLPLDAFCHVWAADRAEEPAPGRFRLYGCFCMPAAPVAGTLVRPRLTIEVADMDAGGTLLDTYGSPHALRVDEFGTERCATFTRGLARLPGGGLVLADSYPADCRVELRDAGGNAVRILAAAVAAPQGGTFREEACPLVGLQRLGGEGTIPVR